MSAFGGGPKDEILDDLRGTMLRHNLTWRQMLGLVIEVLAYLVAYTDAAE